MPLKISPVPQVNLDKMSENPNSPMLADVVSVEEQAHENFDPNMIVEETIAHESGNKYTKVQMRYKSEIENEISIKVEYRSRTIDWVVICDIMEYDVQTCIESYS